MDAPGEPLDDSLWSAVGDPTRRLLLDLLLAQGASTATRLSRDVPVTRQAVTKHLAVLTRTGLVATVTRGRERHYTVDEARLARATAQLRDVGDRWDARLRRIRGIAEELHASQGRQDPVNQDHAHGDEPPS